MALETKGLEHPLTPSELAEYSTDDLMEMREALTWDMTCIRDQLAQAAQQKEETGEYADRDWYRRAQFALRAKGKDCMGIQTEFSKRNRAAKVANTEVRTTFERAFMVIARRELDRDVYKGLLFVVNQEYGFSEAP